MMMTDQQVIAYSCAGLSAVGMVFLLKRILGSSGKTNLVFRIPQLITLMALGLTITLPITGVFDLTSVLFLFVAGHLAHLYATSYRGGTVPYFTEHKGAESKWIRPMATVFALAGGMFATDQIKNIVMPAPPIKIIDITIDDSKSGDPLWLNVTFIRNRECPGTVYYYVIENQTNNIEKSGTIVAGQSKVAFKPTTIRIKLDAGKLLPGVYRYRHRRVDSCPNRTYVVNEQVEPIFTVRE